MNAWEYLNPARKKPDPPVDAAETKQVAGEEYVNAKGETKTVTKQVLRHVDDFYDDLASARDALWEAMSRAKALSNLFDDQSEIGRISRMMVYLRLKRQGKFHNWNAEQLKEQIPYWRKLFVDNEIKRFITTDDYFPTDVGKSDAEEAKNAVYDALKKRNRSPNADRDNRNLQKKMQTVIHYYIDTFNVTEMNIFLDTVYEILIGKQVKEVDDSVDDDHLRYMIQKIRQEREQEREKRAILIQSVIAKKVMKQKRLQEQERLERERQEEQERLERERQEEQERLERERIAQKRLQEQERLERERLEREQRERERKLQSESQKFINFLKEEEAKEKQRGKEGTGRPASRRKEKTKQIPPGTSDSSQEGKTSSSPKRKTNGGNTQRRRGRGIPPG